MDETQSPTYNSAGNPDLTNQFQIRVQDLRAEKERWIEDAKIKKVKGFNEAKGDEMKGVFTPEQNGTYQAKKEEVNEEFKAKNSLTISK